MSDVQAGPPVKRKHAHSYEGYRPGLDGYACCDRCGRPENSTLGEAECPVSRLAERDAEVERLRKLANRGYDVEVLFHQYKAEKVRSDVKLEADRDRLKAENERLEAEAQDAESVRAAALDEAARVCELYRVDPPAIVREALPHIDYEAFNTCLERSADAIRARKGGAW